MKNRKGLSLIRGGIALSAITLLSCSMAAKASTVTVRVVDAQSHQPISGAVVCLGAEGKPSAYGAAPTNSAGEVVYPDVPKENFLLSVADNSNGSYARLQERRDFDTIYYVALDGRSGRSHCSLSSSRDGAPKNLGGKRALRLNGVEVKSHSHANSVVELHTDVTGVKPTHIRASTDADFKNAKWMPYRQKTHHSVQKVSSQDLYVQVRRLVSRGDASIEAVSNPVVAMVSETH